MATTLSLPPTTSDRALPASRASWCGTLQIAGRSTPVKAYPAIATPSSGLCQLHGQCGQRIRHKKWCAVHGLIPDDEIVKAYEYGSNDYVELSEAELRQLRPADDKTIRVEQFFRPDDFDPILFSGRSLYLVPAHPISAPAYLAALSALGQAGVWGLTTMILSDRQPVIVRPAALLMLHVLHWPSLRRGCPFEPNGEVTSATDLRELLKEINRTTRSPDWNELSDDADAKFTELLQSKIAARQTSTSKTGSRPRRARGSSSSRQRKAA